jgi:hypothetical protein
LLKSGGHRIDYCEDVPVGVSDYDNIPERYLEEECANKDVHFVFVLVDEISGGAEWVPPMGPAPIWSHPTAARLPRLEMVSLVENFWTEIYSV